eukprot:265653-Hanusia_phi.AAC.2
MADPQRESRQSGCRGDELQLTTPIRTEHQDSCQSDRRDFRDSLLPYRCKQTVDREHFLHLSILGIGMSFFIIMEHLRCSEAAAATSLAVQPRGHCGLSDFLLNMCVRNLPSTIDSVCSTGPRPVGFSGRKPDRESCISTLAFLDSPKDVMVSFQSPDVKIASFLKTELESRGLRATTTHQDGACNLARGVCRAKAILCLVSAQVASSPHLQAEVAVTAKLGKKLVWVHMDETRDYGSLSGDMDWLQRLPGESALPCGEWHADGRVLFLVERSECERLTGLPEGDPAFVSMEALAYDASSDSIQPRDAFYDAVNKICEASVLRACERH